MALVDGPFTIRQYAHQRPSKTGTGASVTLERFADVVERNEGFAVFDAEIGGNIVRSVLQLIICEHARHG